MTEIDVRKATEIAIGYLESVYGSLNTALFRIEDVKQNGDATKYLVLCSLLTSLGSSKRVYYFMKVDIATKNLISIQKGFKDNTTGNIVWEKINLPED